MVGNGLWAIDRPHETFLPDVAGLAVSLGTAALLVPGHAALGAALATLAGTTTGSLLKALRFVQLVRELPAGPSSGPGNAENPTLSTPYGEAAAGVLPR
jgi:O-antigen/teichoic acid export membrane protein